MANPEHIEWLLEGVETWNRRREQEDFGRILRERISLASFEKRKNLAKMRKILHGVGTLTPC